MERTYRIRKIPLKDVTAEIWEEIPAAPIDCYAWDESGYRPNAQAQVFMTEEGFRVRLRAYETKIVAKELHTNEYVYTESCLEFFIKPDPLHDDRYFNLEFNPFGTVYMSLGTQRQGRIMVEKTMDRLLGIEAVVTPETLSTFKGPYWEIVFAVPFSYIEAYFGKLDFPSGKVLEGNFYKCGEITDPPHFGSWNPVVSPKPDFHRPECFGKLVLE